MKPDVLLTTYEGLRTQEFREFVQNMTTSDFRWTCVIVDECQKVKSGKKSSFLQLLSQLKRDTMVLLTGTPIQNTTEELFPLFTLLHPSTFYYEQPKNVKARMLTPNGWNAARFNSQFSDIQER